jgi:vancomycin permeability regulator SanA
VAIPKRRGVLVAIILVLAVALSVVLVTGVAVWNAAHTDDASRVQSADAIIVLGAAQYEGAPSPVFAGRLDGAKILFEQQRAPAVLIVGGGQPGEGFTEAASGRHYLIDRGVPESSVTAIPVGSDSLESLRAAASYMDGHGMHSAFLVSDPWHNLRIKRMASDLGIVPYASATWHSAAVSQSTRLSGYIREVFAYLYYRLTGR